MRSRSGMMAMLHVAAALASMEAVSPALMAPSSTVTSSKATGKTHSQERLTKAEKKRERKARQRARLLAQNEGKQ